MVAQMTVCTNRIFSSSVMPASFLYEAGNNTRSARTQLFNTLCLFSAHRILLARSLKRKNRHVYDISK